MSGVLFRNKSRSFRLFFEYYQNGDTWYSIILNSNKNQVVGKINAFYFTADRGHWQLLGRYCEREKLRIDGFFIFIFIISDSKSFEFRITYSVVQVE